MRTPSFCISYTGKCDMLSRLTYGITYDALGQRNSELVDCFLLVFCCWNGRPKFYLIDIPTTNSYCLHIYILDFIVCIHYYVR